jgi:alpha-mannosidase
LGLFQHHDAITGTSKAHVTQDYLGRLLISIKEMVKIQQNLIESILQLNDRNRVKNFLTTEIQQETIDKSPKKKVIEVKKDESVEIFIYNSLAQERVEGISIFVSAPNVKVTNSKGYELNYQVNQVLGENFFEIIFIAKLSGLSINSFGLSYREDVTGKMGQVSSGHTVENDKMVLTFNETSGLLSSIFDKLSAKGSIVKMIFGAYKSTMRDSGAYLFKPSNEISNFMASLQTEVVFTKGPIAEDVTVIRDNFLVHKVRIFNSKTHLDDAISIVNEIDFGTGNKNSDIEMFMKIRTSIKNGKEPEFFTDQNGFHWQQRRKISHLGIEANYYPITSCAFMQDNESRLSLMTTHAQGAASLNEGEIEVMLDRRTSIDDGRGMGEGVWDSIKMQHKFYLTLEYFKENLQRKDSYQVPSLLVQHLTNALNYPTNIFINDKIQAKSRNEIKLLQYEFPCDHHLVNLRTLTDDELEWLPSQSALLILHRFGFDCEFKNEYLLDNVCGSSSELNSLQFVHGIKVATAERTSLTALKKNYEIDYFNEPLEAMEIRTYNITFG